MRNTSCSPNAFFRWDIGSFSLALYAIRPIKPNEPITISYTDLLAPINDRKPRLQSTYGFNCRCESCSLTGSKISKSNTSRALILDWVGKDVRPSFKEWFAKTDPAVLNPDALSRFSEEYWSPVIAVLKVINRESLEVFIPAFSSYADSLARVFGARGDVEKFEQFTRKAISYWKVESAWSAKARQRLVTYDQWLAKPESFKYWASRKAVGQGDEAKENAKK
jgi:hypothetical protein